MLRAGIKYLNQLNANPVEDELKVNFLKNKLEKLEVPIDMALVDGIKDKWVYLADHGKLEVWQAMQQALAKSAPYKYMPAWAKRLTVQLKQLCI